MKLLADECCDATTVARLRALGYDVLYVAEGTAGVTDEAVLKSAYDEERLLLTEDKDFGELTIRLGRPAHGLILVRMGDADGVTKANRIGTLLGAHADRFHGHFSVVTSKTFRARPLGRPA